MQRDSWKNLKSFYNRNILIDHTEKTYFRQCIKLLTDSILKMMNFWEISWMKKNAITANMLNLILAFAPNTTVDTMKD